MEKYTMFMDWKNQYSENEYTTQSNLQIQKKKKKNFQMEFISALNDSWQQFPAMFGMPYETSQDAEILLVLVKYILGIGTKLLHV